MLEVLWRGAAFEGQGPRFYAASPFKVAQARTGQCQGNGVVQRWQQWAQGGSIWCLLPTPTNRSGARGRRHTLH